MHFTTSFIAAALAAPAVLAAPHNVWHGQEYSVVVAPSGTKEGYGWVGKTHSKIMVDEVMKTVLETVTAGAAGASEPTPTSAAEDSPTTKASNQKYPTVAPSMAKPSPSTTPAAANAASAAPGAVFHQSHAGYHHHSHPVVKPSPVSSSSETTSIKATASKTTLKATSKPIELPTSTYVAPPQPTSETPEPTTSAPAPEPTTSAPAEPATTAAPATSDYPTTSSSSPAPATSSSSSSTGLPADGLQAGDCGSLSAQTYADISVYHHNIHRRNHSMPDTKWSPTIAGYAAEAAKKCDWSHDMSAYGSYGSNLAGSSMGTKPGDDGTVPPNPSSFITDMWYNGEVNKFTGYGLSASQYPTDGYESWGHFTQVVWPDSTEIGCASSACQGGWYALCMYSTPGNMNNDYGVIGAPKKGGKTVTGNV